MSRAASPPPLPYYCAARGMSKDLMTRNILMYLIRLAAVYHGPGTSLRDLSCDLGLSPNALSNAARRGVISAEVAEKIEHVVGRNLLCKEWFTAPLSLLK